MVQHPEQGREPAPEARRAIPIAVLRSAMVALVAVAIVATLLDTAARTPINPFNFFGFFTMQSNIIAAVVLGLTAAATFRGRAQPQTLKVARACATTYIVIVGIVYNLLLAGLAGGVMLPWANWVMHVAFPVYAALDWVLFADRVALPWRGIGLVLTYPALWIVVVLVRGATDGWVPYPFLDPATGYGSVALYCLGIAVAVVLVGVVVFAVSRLRVVRVTER